jgi:hypothetical protein
MRIRIGEYVPIPVPTQIGHLLTPVQCLLAPKLFFSAQCLRVVPLHIMEVVVTSFFAARPSVAHWRLGEVSCCTHRALAPPSPHSPPESNMLPSEFVLLTQRSGYGMCTMLLGLFICTGNVYVQCIPGPSKNPRNASPTKRFLFSCSR